MSHLRRHRCHRLRSPAAYARPPPSPAEPPSPSSRRSARRRGHPGRAASPPPCPAPSAPAARRLLRPRESPGARPAGAPRRGSHLPPARATGGSVTDAPSADPAGGAAAAASAPAPLPRARRPAPAGSIGFAASTGSSALVVDEVRDVHVRRAPLWRLGPRAGGGGGGRAAQRRGRSGCRIPGSRRIPRPSLPRHPARRTVARHRRHRRRVVKSAPGSRQGDPGDARGDRPGDGVSKILRLALAAFAPSPPSSPASFFPRARARRDPRLVAAGERGEVSEVEQRLRHLLLFLARHLRLGLGLRFRPRAVLAVRGVRVGAFQDCAEETRGWNAGDAKGSEEVRTSRRGAKEKEAKKRKRRRFPKDTRNPRRMKHVASTVGNRPENLDLRDSRWRKSGERRLAGNRASEGNPRAGRADARMPRSMLSAPYLFLPSSAPKAPARSSRLGSAGRS